MQLSSYEKRGFGLNDIRHMVHAMYVAKPFASFQLHMPVAGLGIVMQATEHNGSDLTGNYCNGVRHVIQDCTILKTKLHRFGTNLYAQPYYNQHALCHGEAGGGKSR